MSNAKICPSVDSELCSPSSSPAPTVSEDGAMTIRSASSTRSCTFNSIARPTNSGAPRSDQTDIDLPSLAARVAATDYLHRIGNVAESIAETTEQSMVQSLLREGSDVLGAESAAFISFERDDDCVCACRFMLACDPAWCRQYLDAGLIAHDPWLAYAAHHSEPIIASTLTITEPERQRTHELVSRHGFASAVVVPVHSGAGHSRISLLLLGSSAPGYFEAGGFLRFRLGARTLACELHEWWLARIRRELLATARITAGELELLRHQCQGHGSKRIAAELRVSKSSVNSRFQRMNMKLGVPNRRMAAQLATECGLIML